MPSNYQIGLPIPRDYDEFENMVKLYFNSKYNVEFQKYGRSGQSQSGIDLISGSIGVQCKNYFNTLLTIDIIEKEINKAEKIIPPLTEYYIVTTAQRNNKIQNYIRNKKSNMKIEIYYWDVIENFLLQNMNICKLFYPADTIRNTTQEFIEEYLRLCYNYDFYRIFQNANLTGAIRQELFISIDNLKEDLLDLINSEKRLGVDEKVYFDISIFIQNLCGITETLAIISTPNEHGISKPKYSIHEKEKIINEIEESCKKLQEIYFYYNSK